MKGIGTFVAILVLGMGVTMYVVTRPPNRELDAQGRTWVGGFDGWATAKQHQIDRALAGMGFRSEPRNARLIERLRGCTRALVRMGEPPGFLERVETTTQEGCARAEHAVRVNDRFGRASLATVKFHLDEAEDRIALAQRTLHEELDKS